MFINKIIVKNFRRFDENGIEICFNSGINIVLGENNIGKSAIIDAIRLALSSGQYRKSLYLTLDDFHIDKYGRRTEQINIDLYFEDLSDEQASAFYLLTDGTDTSRAELHVQYQLQKDSKGNDKIKDYFTGGPGNNPLTKDVFDNINLLYLPALRNAEGDLKPSRNSQLAKMLTTVASTDEDKQRVLAAFISANETIKLDPAIKSIEQLINKNLESIEKEELQQNINVNLIEPTFDAIAASLDVGYIVEHSYMIVEKKKFLELLKEKCVDTKDVKGKKIVRKIDDENIEVDLIELKKYSSLEVLYKSLIFMRNVSRITLGQNGLGYNNILSMATSLGDLQKKPSDEEISVLLVEEPEAHLHPQLLDLLFNFFKKSGNTSKIQIFLTSHSPSLVSKSDIDSIHIMYNDGGRIKNTSLNKVGLSDVQKEDLKRYLDVTKSQMFFAKRVVFVEGISEAILLNEFAKLLEKPFDKYSVEIININGVAFEPFAQLFRNNEKNTNIKFPCAIISDNDRCTNYEDKFRITKDELIYSKVDINNLSEKLEKGSISYRAEKLLTFKGNNICVELAEKTLEYELALIKENNDLLLEILSTEHPDMNKSIKNKIVDGEEQSKIAIRIWIAIRDCKGTFAQKLATQISMIESGKRSDIQFIVPKYIQRAIKHIIP